MRRKDFIIALLLILLPISNIRAQINTDRVLLMGRNALYYEDYVLAIQRFNMVITAKPWLGEPYFFRGLAKFYLEDYQGAEIDCTSAVERNPYSVSNYELRALCRINQQRYALAEEDYVHAVGINPLQKSSWHNMVLCQMELKEFARADSSLDVMIRQWPKEAEHYTLKAQVSLSREDTVTAETWIDVALEHNNFEGRAWSMKALFQSARSEYMEAEESLDKAILQTPKVAGLYVNRALARYYQDNLRGAMSDYDTALDIEPRNYVGHFNRGLLRANVGDDNLAIEDFNFVLELEPDNTIALYNRALLLDNIGDYNGAIRDISAVIKDYPEFWEGYRKRASILRKIGDIYGAERDEFKILEARMAVAAGTYKSSGKTRKNSEHNIEDYDKLVEEDAQESENEFRSDYRGKVQNRQTELKVGGVYLLTYYKKSSDVKLYSAFSQDLEKLNDRKVLPHRLYLTEEESAMTEEQTQLHLTSIAELSARLEHNDKDVQALFQRALDYYHVRDFENAVADMDLYIQYHGEDVLSLMLRAQSRYAQLQVQMSTSPATDLRLGRIMVMQDYIKASDLCPEAAFLHYNVGCIRFLLSDYTAAVQSFTRAIELDEQFPDAYFGRGVTYIMEEKVPEGLSDLSKAGEYGLYSAYNLIKKYSKEKK